MAVCLSFPFLSFFSWIHNQGLWEPGEITERSCLLFRQPNKNNYAFLVSFFPVFCSQKITLHSKIKTCITKRLMWKYSTSLGERLFDLCQVVYKVVSCHWAQNNIFKLNVLCNLWFFQCDLLKLLVRHTTKIQCLFIDEYHLVIKQFINFLSFFSY